MNNKMWNRVAVATVFGAALSTVVISQVGLADQATPASPGDTLGVASVLGNQELRSGDPRFRPMAMAIVNEASGAGRLGSPKGGTLISETILTDVFHRYIYSLPSNIRRVAPMRPLTPSEALILEELFSMDLKGQQVQINRHGISGDVAPPAGSARWIEELARRGKALGAQKSLWYEKAAKSIPAG